MTLRTVLLILLGWFDAGLVVCLFLSALHFPHPEEDQ